MKKMLYTIGLIVLVSISISACSEETIQPVDSGGTLSDKCQFGGPGCPKG